MCNAPRFRESAVWSAHNANDRGRLQVPSLMWSPSLFLHLLRFTCTPVLLDVSPPTVVVGMELLIAVANVTSSDGWVDTLTNMLGEGTCRNVSHAGGHRRTSHISAQSTCHLFHGTSLEDTAPVVTIASQRGADQSHSDTRIACITSPFDPPDVAETCPLLGCQRWCMLMSKL